MKLLTLTRLRLSSNPISAFLLPLLVFVCGCGNAGTVTEQADTGCAGLDINSASADDLDGLPGIGPVTAIKIVRHRDRYGRFRRPQHLMLVDGVSRKKFRSIDGLIHTC